MDQRRIIDGPLFVSGIFVLRVFFGLVYLTNGLAKFVPGIAHTPYGFLIDLEGARGIITFDAHHNQVGSYRSLVDQVLLPNWNVFGNLQGALEVLVGILLIVGLAAVWAALLAPLLSLHVQFAALYNGEWLYAYAVEWIPLLCLAALRPGHWLGLDGALAARRRAGGQRADGLAMAGVAACAERCRGLVEPGQPSFGAPEVVGSGTGGGYAAWAGAGQKPGSPLGGPREYSRQTP